MERYSLDGVLAVSKPRDSWWTVLLADPLAIRLVRWLANRTPVTPGQVTAVSFMLGIAAAGCFAQGAWAWLAVGALLFYASFVLDCADGKLARLTGGGSPFGIWLDFAVDQVRFLSCALVLLYVQFSRTGNVAFLYAALLVLGCDLIRYLNASQMAKVRRELDVQPGTAAASDSSWFGRVRANLLRRRIRTHLVSGIELQMAVCVFAPLAGFIIPVISVAGIAMLLFEAGVTFRFWRSIRSSGPLATSIHREPAAILSLTAPNR